MTDALDAEDVVRAAAGVRNALRSAIASASVPAPPGIAVRVRTLNAERRRYRKWSSRCASRSIQASTVELVVRPILVQSAIPKNELRLSRAV